MTFSDMPGYIYDYTYNYNPDYINYKSLGQGDCANWACQIMINVINRDLSDALGGPYYLDEKGMIIRVNDFVQYCNERCMYSETHEIFCEDDLADFPPGMIEPGCFLFFGHWESGKPGNIHYTHVVYVWQGYGASAQCTSHTSALSYNILDN